MEILEYTGKALAQTNGELKYTSITENQISIQRLKNYQDNEIEKDFRIIWVSDGVDTVEIDFDKFQAVPNLIIFVSPEQSINLQTGENPTGWVLRFSKSYFSLLKYEKFSIGNIEIFKSAFKTPKIVLSPKIGERIHALAGMIDELAGSEIPNKENGIYALLKTILVYCDSKCNVNLNKSGTSHEVDIVNRFKRIVVENFTKIHQVSAYARMMNISPKYLNQVVKQILGVTAKYVIQEQLIIRARSDLKFTNHSIKEIAFALGFADPFHFSSFFKEFTGCPPSQYRNL
jgi:AraC family transcriptional regulator, transcriptional activator of pobA